MYPEADVLCAAEAAKLDARGDVRPGVLVASIINRQQEVAHFSHVIGAPRLDFGVADVAHGVSEHTGREGANSRFSVLYSLSCYKRLL